MSVIVSKIDEWAVEACDDPKILIRISRGEGRPDLFYRVLAHWEFDAEKAADDQQDCCQEVATLFADNNAGHCFAAEVKFVDAESLRASALSRRPCTTCPPPKNS